MRKVIVWILILMVLFSASGLASTAQVKKLVKVAVKQVETPYEFFSDEPNSFNCFSFVMYCCNQVSKNTISWGRINKPYVKISRVRNVKSGDILCFKRSSDDGGLFDYHYGIYVGNGYFVHAKNVNDGVVLSKLKSYKKRFVGAIRVF